MRFRFILLTAVVAGAMLATMLLTTGGRFAFPLDDPYIYFQYAVQNAGGDWFRYNDGDPPTTGATSLLYLLLLTPLALVLKGTALALASFVISAVMLGFTLSTLGALASRWIDSAARWPAVFLTAICGPFLWGAFSGMETSLLALVSVRFVATLASSPAAPRAYALWGSLLALSRPEAALLVIALGALMLARRRAARPARAILITLGAAVIPFLVNLALTGTPGSMTLASKGAFLLPGTTLGTWLIETMQFFLHNLKGLIAGGAADAPAWPSAYTTLVSFAAPFTLLFALFGAAPAVVVEWRARAPGAGVAGSVLVLGTLAMWAATVPINIHWSRYILPFLPLLVLFVVAGAHRVAALWATPDDRTAVRRGILGFFFLCAVPIALFFVAAYGWNCREIQEQHIEMAEWIRRGTPERAWIGTNDVGAIRYYGRRPILDLHGLVSRELAACKQVGSGAIYEYLEALPPDRRPSFLVLIPGWYEPGFYRIHRAIRSQSLRKAMIAGSPLVLYATDWRLAGSGDLPGTDALEMTRGRQLADRVDIADLADEQSHAYRLDLSPGESAAPIGILHAPGEGRLVVDGGRLVTGREAMRVDLRPGRDAIVVMRSMGALRAELRVDDGAPNALSGRPAGPPGAASDEAATWTEAVVLIPANQIRNARPTITVQAFDGAYAEGGYTSFHYWFYQ